ncbi:MAG: SAM-dependent methyltransferase [Pseudomonadota bacterium]
MSKPRGSSSGWRERQEKDPWVRKARTEGYRSRAVYKLEELTRNQGILRRGMRVADLGAAPGGWSQWVARQLDDDVSVVAVDLLPMDALAGVHFIQGDFREQAVLDAVTESVGNERLDLVMSDMAPNISGVKAVDQPRSMYLAELALDFATEMLGPKGVFVCKVFQGEGFDEYVRALRRVFVKVAVKKPKASRPTSTEVYALARTPRLV